MKKILLFLFLFANFIAFSQNFEWVKTQPITFNSNGSMIGYTTTCDPTGNVYISGFKENTYLYSEIFGDVFYNKYNGAGELQFSKTFTGHTTVYDMVSDSDGNILVCAGFVNAIAVDDLAIDTVDQGVQNILFKFDASGNLLWHEQFEIDGSPECRVHTMTTDADKNIYVGYYDFQHSYIKKLSPDGTLLMTISQQHVRMISSISVDNAGNIYAAGSCADPTANYNGVAVPATFSYNTFIVKYAPTGVYQWVRYVDDITCPDPQVVARTPDEVYFSSILFGNYVFDGIETEGPITSFSDIFITRLNAEGTFQWVREVPGSGIIIPGGRRYLTADMAGNVYFAGSTRNTIVWTDEITTVGTGFTEDAIVLQYDKNGNLLMAKTAGGVSSDRIDAIEVGASGDIYVAGMSRGPAAFDTFAFEADQYQYWPFLGKLTNVALGVNGQQLSNIRFYPNPASDYIYVAGTTQSIHANVINMLGQQVMDFEISAGDPADIHSLPKGTYLIKPDGSRAMKLIKN
jgi:hypothetical protein